MSDTPVLTGGCQCGAVRFRVEGETGRASICWCRMCQKAFAGPFGALVTVNLADLTWTRGAPSRFQSSDAIQRGFCAACGTPLFYDIPEADTINLVLGTLDDPEAVKPVAQSNTGRKMACLLYTSPSPRDGLLSRMPSSA